MKRTRNLLGVAALLFASNLFSCKTTEMTKPVPVSETQDVKTLKQFYASTAKVSADAVSYDTPKDEFSIGGTSRISHAKLSIAYDLAKNRAARRRLNN